MSTRGRMPGSSTIAMPRWIALLRGVNVGGKNKMPMARLKALLTSLGCAGVRTYIQSGNVVLSSSIKTRAKLERKMLDAIEREFGFRPSLLLVSESQFRESISKNPFVDALTDPKTLHFFFLASAPAKPDYVGMAKLATKTERYQVIDNVCYFHAPDGFGTSKLAAAAERKLGVSATARNYNTVDALVRMLDES